MSVSIFSYSWCLLSFHGQFGCSFASHSAGLQARAFLPHTLSCASLMHLFHSVQLCSGSRVGGSLVC